MDVSRAIFFRHTIAISICVAFCVTEMVFNGIGIKEWRTGNGTDIYEIAEDLAIGTIHVYADGDLHGGEFAL